MTRDAGGRGGASIELRSATVRRGGRMALDGFTGVFPAGEVSAVIGGDGAGKSTLLRALAGRDRFVPEQRGVIRDRIDIGYQPGDTGVWRGLSVEENVSFAARAYGLSAAERRERADELLALAGLDTARRRLAGRLSGGMRQKLGFVLATLHRPGLLLLDEPTTGVDPVSRGELWGLIAGAAADGAVVVFATTYPDEAERAARVFLLEGGRMIAAGTRDDVVAGMPGALWSTRASAAPEPAASAARSWRRGEAVRLWTADAAGSVPPGFARRAPDLEDASVGYLLDAASREGQAPPTRPARSATRPPRHATGEEKPPPLLSAERITHRFGSFTAVRDVSLHVAPGEVVGLLGGNGAGKTTLMRIVLGLERPTSGTVTLFGERPSLDSRRRVGYLAQGLGLYPSLSAIDDLRFVAAVQGVGIPDDVVAFARAFGRAPVGSLPLGARRSLAFVAARLHDPGLLVLDEPTSGMDALARADLWNELRAMAESGTGILVTTHYMQEAQQCDRLVMLSAGRVTASGTVDEMTAGHRSVLLNCEHWAEAFRTLRAAGVPVMLEGRALRVPESARERAEMALVASGGSIRIEDTPAVLEEIMMRGDAEWPE